jgi:DNA-binding response OmpR family regulator
MSSDNGARPQADARIMDTIPARSMFPIGENATQVLATQKRSIGCRLSVEFGHQPALLQMDMMKEQAPLGGLLFSGDAQVVSVMNQLLDSFTIKTEVCGELDSALEAVTHHRLDAVIVDWNSVRDPNRVVCAARKSSANSNSTIVAMVEPGFEAYALLAGANFMITKPTDLDHARRCMRAAHGTMLQNRRRSARVAVDLPMVLRVIEGERHEARISDISIGGIAVRSERPLQLDQKVTALFTLPQTTNLIYLSGAVVNADRQGRAGVRFSFIPDEDLATLQTWLAGELIKLESAEVQAEKMVRNAHSEISVETAEYTRFSSSPLAPELIAARDVRP